MSGQKMAGLCAVLVAAAQAGDGSALTTAMVVLAALVLALIARRAEEACRRHRRRGRRGREGSATGQEAARRPGPRSA